MIFSEVDYEGPVRSSIACLHSPTSFSSLILLFHRCMDIRIWVILYLSGETKERYGDFSIANSAKLQRTGYHILDGMSPVSQSLSTFKPVNIRYHSKVIFEPVLDLGNQEVYGSHCGPGITLWLIHQEYIGRTTNMEQKWGTGWTRCGVERNFNRNSSIRRIMY